MSDEPDGERFCQVQAVFESRVAEVLHGLKEVSADAPRCMGRYLSLVESYFLVVQIRSTGIEPFEYCISPPTYG